MAARKQLVIIYSYNEGWIGGTYYIQSLVQSLTLLEDDKKPNLIILCNTDEEFCQIQQTGYPYLTWWKYEWCNFEGELTVADRVINKLSRIFTGKNSIQKPAILNFTGPVDIIFPIPPEFRKFKEAVCNLFWIPDFQELHFPQFFDAKQQETRHALAKYVATTGASVVFSSKDAMNDFNRLFPDNKAVKFVVPFAVTHPDYSQVNIQSALEMYSIKTPYFFAPNQFWVHKDQLTLIKATQRLIESGGIQNFQVVFSGKEDDFRNPDYTNSLKRYVADNGLENHIRFLGFIDRKVQLQIMQHAFAVVQPSLCEGWSTVIEDAKAMNQRIIASDLSVHEEQLQHYNAKLFFCKSSATDLSEKMKQLLEQPFEKESKDYNTNRQFFASTFLNAMEQA